MILAVGIRLAFVVVLLVLQLLTFLVELLPLLQTKYYFHAPWVNQWGFYGVVRRWLVPVLINVVGVTLVAITFARANPSEAQLPNLCNTDVDGDIAGPGVIAGAFTQVGVLIIMSGFGNFHPRPIGTKEIGAGLLLTNISLTLALMVRLGTNSLTLPDAIIGAMVIDAQSVAISIQLTSKEVLSARWQVLITVISQSFSLFAMPFAVMWFTNNKLEPDPKCRCLTVAWWATLGNCDVPSPNLEKAVFWIYFACRFVGTAQTSFHALYNTIAFDKAEKIDRMLPDKHKRFAPRLHSATYPHYGINLWARYCEYPATVSLVSVFYGILALTSLAIAQTSMRDLGIKPTSDVGSIGQIIAIVIGFATLCRGAFLFGSMFWKEGIKQKPVWPFSTGHPSAQTPWFRPFDWSHTFDVRVDDLPIGSVLIESNNPYSRLGNVSVDFLFTTTKRHVEHNWTYPGRLGNFDSAHSDLNFKVQDVHRHQDSCGLKASAMQTDYIENPRSPSMQDLLSRKEVMDLFTPGIMYVTLYIVTATKVATGLKERSSWYHRDNVLYAYRLEEITLTAEGGVITPS